MTTHTAQENYGRGHRTFDCPWCGAISGIPADLIGETFQCPECKETTKLTPKNTRGQNLIPGEEDARGPAPGDLTFDCPWCGAISPVPPGAVGTVFECPECHNKTRLTEKTTRRADLFVPPPGAPHHEEAPGFPGWIFAVLGVLALGVIAWAVFGRSRGEGTSTQEQASRAGESGGAGEGTKVPVEPPGPAEGEANPTGPSSADAETTPTGPMPPAPAPESPELTAARERLAAAERTYAAAQAALSSWLHENAGRLAKAERADAARAIQGMIEREQKALEEGAPTPDAMRASNRKLATAIASDPSMREAAEIVYETLRRVPYAPVRARRWQDLNFLAPTFSDAVAELVRGGMVGVGEEQAALQEKVERAGKEAVAARTALEALEGPEASPPR